MIFRQNAASAGDLIDVLAGRVRIHLRPTPAQPVERIFCSAAVITAIQTSTVAIAVDEDDAVRIDVIEGQVRVLHKLLPQSEPILVKAVDAVLIQKNHPISRRMDRGSLYRYTIRVLSAITPGHPGKNGDPVEGNKFLADLTP